MKRVIAGACVVACGLVVGTATGSVRAQSGLFDNCTQFNKRYPHGVGKANARDRTKSGDPVTTFKRSTSLYLKAIRANSDLDRDKDGVACEKK